MSRKGSKVEGASENALHSHRSSSSNWSTTDNSLKKDGVLDQREGDESKISPKIEPERKTIDDVCSHLDSESLRKASIGSIRPKSSVNEAIETAEAGPSSINSKIIIQKGVKSRIRDKICEGE